MDAIEKALTWEELFAEPGEQRSPHWFSAAYARLLAVGGPRPFDLEHAPCAERARRIAWGRPPDLPDPLAVGSARPALVLVGESLPAADRRAFLSRSGHWLLRAIRAAGWAEEEILLTNAQDPPPERGRRGPRRTEVLRALAAWLAPVGPSWVALGRETAEVMRAAGISATEAPHPQWHTRFATAEGPGGFAERLLAAGMPAGPWRGKPLPVVPHADARTALADRFGTPADVAFRKGRPPDDHATGEPHVNVSKREEARRRYVVGEDETIKAAAIAVGCSYDDLLRVSREERWVEQRDRHAHEATDRAIRDAARSEAKAVAASRRLAWAATQLALKSIVERLQSQALTPEIREAVALVAGARQLAELESPAGAPTDRPLADLVREAKRLLVELEDGEEV